MPASFLPCNSVEVCLDELAVLLAAESSSVVTKGSVAVCESCEARETMVMSMSSLEMPLETCPMMRMSF